MHVARRAPTKSGINGRRFFRTFDMTLDMSQYARRDRDVPYQVSMGSYSRTVRSKVRQVKYWVVGVIVGAAWLGADALRYKIPFTHRAGGMKLPYGLDVSIGGKLLENEIVEENILPPDHQYCRLVRRILERVLLAIDKEKANETGLEDCLQWDWRFTIVENETPNAYCFPGGNVCVHTGLIQRMDTEEKVALFVAHEIAHALAHHGTEKLLLRWMLQIVTGILFPDSPPIRSTKNVMQLSYSRSKELEADEIGLHLCLSAGYDISTRTITSAYSSLSSSAAAHSHSTTFFSTHPSTPDRIAHLNALLPKIEHRYKRPPTVPPPPPVTLKGLTSPFNVLWYPWFETTRYKRVV